MRFTMLAIASLLAVGAPLSAKETPTPEPITIGESFTLYTHDSERRINVVLPRGYGEDEAEYPIVLMLDGGLSQDFFLALGLERWNQLWGRSQRVIFVGVQTVDRQREMLPETGDAAERETYPTAGESAVFRVWLRDEVLPLLRASYRDDGRAFLIGESAAGHFVTETWLTAPEMFDGYAALSPSMQWNNQALSRAAQAASKAKRPPLFVSLADEGGATEEGMQRFLASAGASACFADKRESQVVHANSLHQMLPEALQYLLPTEADWLAEYGLTISCQIAGENTP